MTVGEIELNNDFSPVTTGVSLNGLQEMMKEVEKESDERFNDSVFQSFIIFNNSHRTDHSQYASKVSGRILGLNIIYDSL